MHTLPVLPLYFALYFEFKLFECSGCGAVFVVIEESMRFIWEMMIIIIVVVRFIIVVDMGVVGIVIVSSNAVLIHSIIRLRLFP
jgi:hypothetical protein